jgi:hypothetical protein
MLLVSVLGCGSGTDSTECGHVVVATPPVSLVTGTTTTPLPPNSRTPVTPGAKIVTGKGGEAILACGKQVMAIGPESEFAVASSRGDSTGASEVSLFQGVVMLLLPKDPTTTGNRFRATCGTVIAAVKGTRFEFKAGPDRVEVRVFEGTVEVSRTGGTATVSLPGGQMASFPLEDTQRQVQPAPIGESELSALKARALIYESRATKIIGTY